MHACGTFTAHAHARAGLAFLLLSADYEDVDAHAHGYVDGYVNDTSYCAIAWRGFPCETELPAVALHVNTWLRALCVVCAVLGTVEGVRAQTTQALPAEPPPVTPEAVPVPPELPPASTTTSAPAPIKLTLHGPRSADATAGDTGKHLPIPPEPVAPLERERSGWSPTVFWIAASATVITASLGGFQALHVKDLYDQANGIPVVSPERNSLRDQMRSAEVTADVLLVGSVVLALGTTLLAFQIDWSGHDRPRDRVATLPPSASGRRWW